MKLAKREQIFAYIMILSDLFATFLQVSAEDRYRPSPTADSRRPLPSLWHPSRCTLRRLHGNHLHICRPWNGAFRKGQPNSIIELRHAGSAGGLLLSGRIGKNKEGIRAVKTARGLRAHGNEAREVKRQFLSLMLLGVTKCTDTHRCVCPLLCVCVYVCVHKGN